MSKEEKVEFFKEQIKVEKQIVETAYKSVEDIKNVLVREMILAVINDSEKHENMLNALIARLKGPTPGIEEKITDELAENLKQHLELEAKAIQMYKELLEKPLDEKERIIIKTIYEDEIRHHELLRWVHNTIVEKETLIEEDIWEYIWADSFSKGTPGG
ncbi:MAG: ferritin-like domain-containing protein [Candidatus Heimdallarchaeota archaeon]|nr:ferritin-like domain-containing protein [Candidatus Heimdallarchaeota archaeon]